MRSLVRWALMLYPAAWRARYGGELEALMEDAGVRGGDVWDLVRGALFMQMTSLSFGKIVAAFTLAGVLAAGVWAVAQPRQYVSTAVLRMSPSAPAAGEPEAQFRMQQQQRLQRLQQNVLSRKSLAAIISSQNLLREDRKNRPLADIILDMRNKNIRIQMVDVPGGTAFTVNYASADPAEAQAATRAIVAALVEQNVVQTQAAGATPGSLEVLDPASLPSQPSSGDRTAVMTRFALSGLALGLVCGSLWWVFRRSKVSVWRIASFAAAGMALGVVVALLLPNEYISTAVLRTADAAAMQATVARVLSQEAVAAMIRRNGLFTREVGNEGIEAVTRQVRDKRIRVQSVAANGMSAYLVSFQYPDRFAAQKATQDLVRQLMGQANTEVLDPASDPGRPSSPNRMQIALLGVLGGAAIGLAFGYWRREKFATA